MSGRAFLLKEAEREKPGGKDARAAGCGAGAGPAFGGFRSLLRADAPANFIDASGFAASLTSPALMGVPQATSGPRLFLWAFIASAF